LLYAVSKSNGFFAASRAILRCVDSSYRDCDPAGSARPRFAFFRSFMMSSVAYFSRARGSARTDPFLDVEGVGSVGVRDRSGGSVAFQTGSAALGLALQLEVRPDRGSQLCHPEHYPGAGMPCPQPAFVFPGVTRCRTPRSDIAGRRNDSGLRVFELGSRERPARDFSKQRLEEALIGHRLPHPESLDVLPIRSLSSPWPCRFVRPWVSLGLNTVQISSRVEERPSSERSRVEGVADLRSVELARIIRRGARLRRRWGLPVGVQRRPGGR